ncbi:MAG: chromosomal replication initiator protein [Verrucomicrobiales bacterium]|jgi:chromosomal replication initiator protein
MSTSDLKLIWTEICTALKRRVSQDTFKRWFSGTSLLEADEDKLVVQVQNKIFQLWIESNYLSTLKQAVADVLQGEREIEFKIGAGTDGGEIDTETDVEEDESDETFANSSTGQSSDPEKELVSMQRGMGELPLNDPRAMPRGKLGQPQIKTIDPELDRLSRRAGLNPRYRFESFVPGGNSEFAHAACLSVADRPAMTYNPLFIHGAAGLGKTHLLHAIGHRILESNPKKKVVYVTSEEFTNGFIDSIRNGLVKFRKKYRQADVLLIDDIQFFAGKESTQDEFFHTFNSLSDGRRQIVLTSDRPANEINNLEERIVSRCEWGLTAGMQPPDVETRTAILRRKMDEWNVTLDDHVVEFLADRIRKSVRRLEGGLMRLASYTSLSGKSLTDEAIENLLKDILREEGRRRVTINRIQKEVAEHFDIRLADMTSKRRPANIAFPRQVAMYLARTMTDHSLVEIGQAFGGRDHGTVIHAAKKVEQRIDDSKETRQAVAMLSTRLSNM